MSDAQKRLYDHHPRSPPKYYESENEDEDGGVSDNNAYSDTDELEREAHTENAAAVEATDAMTMGDDSSSEPMSPPSIIASLPGSPVLSQRLVRGVAGNKKPRPHSIDGSQLYLGQQHLFPPSLHGREQQPELSVDSNTSYHQRRPYSFPSAHYHHSQHQQHQEQHYYHSQQQQQHHHLQQQQQQQQEEEQEQKQHQNEQEPPQSQTSRKHRRQQHRPRQLLQQSLHAAGNVDGFQKYQQRFSSSGNTSIGSTGAFNNNNNNNNSNFCTPSMPSLSPTETSSSSSASSSPLSSSFFYRDQVTSSSVPNARNGNGGGGSGVGKNTGDEGAKTNQSNLPNLPGTEGMTVVRNEDGSIMVYNPITDAMTFRCELCPLESFGRIHDLKRHQTSKHQEMTWPCDFCHRPFVRRDALLRHYTVKAARDDGIHPASHEVERLLEARARAKMLY
ncbi:hypothetical protein BGZ94_006563 [Podila epigama]|nr:hypothetical protein BGZ94_006563 [Podila epigama]